MLDNVSDHPTVTIEEGEVFVNSARVIAANSKFRLACSQYPDILTIPPVLVSGGVVHLIDSVLNPNSTNVANPDDDEDSVANFPDATSGGLAFTSDVPTATVTAPVTTTAAVLPSDYSTPQAESATSSIGATESMDGSASLPTGAVGAAALFGGVALLANL